MILRFPHCVLSLLLSFRRSGFHLSIPCTGRKRSSGCCVILRSRLIAATSNFVPLRFMPDGGSHQHHLYLLVSTHPSLWISSCVCVFLLSLPRRCVFSLVLSCSRPYRMCILLFLPFDPFRLYIFYPTSLPFLCLYSLLGFCSPLILCYLTCIPFMESLIELVSSLLPILFYLSIYIYARCSLKK